MADALLELSKEYRCHMSVTKKMLSKTQIDGLIVGLCLLTLTAIALFNVDFFGILAIAAGGVSLWIWMLLWSGSYLWCLYHNFMYTKLFGISSTFLKILDPEPEEEE